MDEHFAPEGHSHGPRFLLLGAGFSRNWGGWLASEVFEYLLGTPEVLADDGLRTHLWNYRLGGFEDAINELQRAILASAERQPEDNHSYWDWGSNNTLPLRDHLGKMQSAVNRMEHGRQNLSMETLGRVSDVLNKQLIRVIHRTCA